MRQEETDNAYLDLIPSKINQEVVTQKKLAMRMVTEIKKNVTQNKESTYLNLYCKSGVFLKLLLDRLMVDLEESIPDSKLRRYHILTKQLFGVAPDHDTIRVTCRALYGSFVHTNNIVHIDGIDEWSYKDMKFDVVIGNPPYQENNEGSGRGDGARPIYQKFVDMGIKLSKNYTIMVIPAKWFNSSAPGALELRIQLLNEHTISLVDFPKAIECFPDIELSGGVCYFVHSQLETSEKCKTSTICADKEEKGETVLKNDIYIRYKLGRTVLEKVLSKSENMLGETKYISTKFGIPTATRGETTGDIRLVSSGKGTRYIKAEDVGRQFDVVDKYKVITGYMSPGGGIQKAHRYLVINKPKMLGPGEVFTDTYQMLGVFDTEEEAVAFLNYIQTKFARFMIQITVCNASNTSKNFRFVPIIGCAPDVTDEWLYEYYGLTDEEIDFIESLIKEYKED